MYKKSQHTNSFFKNVNRNVVYPMCNSVHSPNKYSSNIEIVEVNSADDNQNNDEEQNNDECSADNTNDQFHEEESSSSSDDKYNREYIDNMIDYEALKSIYNEFYNDYFDINENILTNYNKKLFTIIENEANASSSSKHDIFENTLYEDKSHKNWNHSSNLFENLFDCDEFDPGEQNVGFCSDNNTYYITEIDESKYFIKGIKHGDNEDMSQRIPTPVPTYIPRVHLPLSPILTTITEIVEPKASVTSCGFDIDNLVQYSLQNNNEYKTLCRPKSANILNPMRLCENKKIKENHEKKQNFNFEKYSDSNNFETREPNVLCDSQSDIIKQTTQAPEVFVCLKLQNNASESTIKDNEDIIYKVKNSQLAEKIVQLLSLDNFFKYKESQIKLTAKIKLESNAVTLFIEQTVGSDTSDKNKVGSDEVLDNDINKSNTIQKYSYKKHENVNKDIIESTLNSSPDLKNKISVKNQPVTVRDVEVKKSTRLRKIIKSILCCK